MTQKITRREWLAASLAMPGALAGLSTELLAEAPAGAWNQPAPLGRSGLEVTRLGLGCGVTDPKVYLRASEAGINHFNFFPGKGDTSAFPVLKKVLKSIRSKVVLASNSGAPGKQGQLDDIDARLRALGTDCIDLWYLTANQKPEDLNDERLAAVQLAKKTGKIRACAASTHAFSKILPRALELRDTITALMVTCNFATWDFGRWSDARDNIAKLRQAGIGVVAMKPMMGGLQFVPQDRREWADALKTEPQRQAALAAALKWVLRNEWVDTVPAAVDNLDQLERNLKAAAEAFTEADRQLLAAAVERVSPHYCRMCQQCEGACRAGLPVADLLRYLMYAEGYQDLPRARREFSELPRALQTVRCEDCSACTVHCPNGVRIRERLIRAQAELA